MDQEIQDNLPIFAMLVAGGLVILGLSSVVLYQQLQGLSSDVQRIEQPVVKTEQKVDASIVGTWESRHPVTGAGEKRFVFQSNGRYTEQYFYQGSIWPKARGAFTYDSQTRALTLNQQDIYQYATFDPPVPSSDQVPYQVNKLMDSELCIEGQTSKGMYGCLVLVEGDDRARPSKDPNFTERTLNPIVGSWESEHQKVGGGEFYSKWVFAADGAFQNSLVNTSLDPSSAPLIEGEYRVGTYRLNSGSVDVIAFTEYRAGGQDNRNMIGSEEAEFVQLFNLKIENTNRICINEPVQDPAQSGIQWQCFNRSSP